jgi:transcriptional regulator with GAF, ATPase, and Fis domain
VSDPRSTVLITGETGTGKELVASELFGHEKGAFTGALERRRDRFELAAGGTIFLDEVGDLPHAVQVALLRVLQEGEFERVGGRELLHTDARVVAASSRDLDEAVREGRLRSEPGRPRARRLRAAEPPPGVPPSAVESRIRRLGIDKHAFRRRGPGMRPI